MENGGYDDITPILKDLAADGAQLIICHASGYQTTCPEFAAERRGPGRGDREPGRRHARSRLRPRDASPRGRLSGRILAGLLTKTGTVAIVVSDEPPSWNYMSVGFAEGLKATKPDAKLLYSVIGDAAYDDSAGAKRVTETVLAAGADIVFGMGDGASFGMIEAVTTHNADNPDAQALFIDVIGDKSATQHARPPADSASSSTSPAIYEQMIRDLDAGTFGSVYTMDLANGGVRLLDLPETIPPGDQGPVAQVHADIVAGTITVSAIGDAEGVNTRLDELFPEA